MNKEQLIRAYRGKNVYVTGITGFKGGWMALMLHHLGANVYGIGLEAEEHSIFHSARINEIANVTIADITDPACNSALMKDLITSNPDYVFHMAAQPIVSLGYKDPYNTFHTNIMGTVILHEILRGLENKNQELSESEYNKLSDIDKLMYDCGFNNKPLSVVNITTDKVYKESGHSHKEGDELFGFDPYSLSKSVSDMITSCYREALTSEHKMSTARAGNVIGGGDMAPNRIVPDIVRSVMDKTAVEIRNPHSIRPYQHVFDAINAYLIIGAMQKQHKINEGAFNVGPDIEQTMTTKELIEGMKAHMDIEWTTTDTSIGHETDILMLDNSKIKSIGWKAKFPTNESVLKSVANWYNSYMNFEDMQKYTLKQIEEAYNS